jgi:hypothetical protein
MVEAVAEQVQRDQRVDPGRLDAAPAAVPLLPRDDPLSAPAHGGRPDRAGRGQAAEVPVVAVQDPVQPAEHGRPAVPARRAGPRRLTRRRHLKLVKVNRPGPDRAQRADDGQRHDGLAGPARPVVHVEREPGRKVDHLRRHDRQLVPRPLAEQGQPDAGEHPGGRDPAGGPDPARGAGHVVGAGVVAGQPQRDVGLDGGGQVGVAAAEVGPRPVLALAGPDPAGGGRGLARRPHAEELAQQEILGVHGDVGLQFALPPALLVLQPEQVVHRLVQRPLGGLRGIGPGGRCAWPVAPRGVSLRLSRGHVAITAVAAPVRPTIGAP